LAFSPRGEAFCKVQSPPVSPSHSQSGVLTIFIVSINGIHFVVGNNSHCRLYVSVYNDSAFVCMPVAVMKSEEELDKDRLDI
jgi:hypothetical protein